MSAGSLTPTRDEKHYWDTIIFQVEDRLFKVPIYLLQKEQDSAFAGMLSLPQGGLNPEDSTDQHPVKLDSDVTKVDFARLLDVMYPTEVPTQYSKFSKDEWISVLKLADKFQLLKTRELAIRRLTQSGPVGLSSSEMIRYERQFSIGGWLMTGYCDLICKPEPLSLEDGSWVGWETLARICIQREALIHASINATRYYQSFPNLLSVHGSGAQEIVEREFKDELASLGYPPSPVETPTIYDSDDELSEPG
ncbi:hypothetical protein C8J56DRAFT_1160560 [Mycena floridula]|nr:hypothetical protein C8J56DRAFT_1160560 [Mycena floridula]